jgi:hypothetical protein
MTVRRRSRNTRKRAADIRLHAHRLTDAVCTAAMLSVADNYERLAAALENIAKRAAARI